MNCGDNIIIDIWISFMGRPNYKIYDTVIAACGGKGEAWALSQKGTVPDIIRKNNKLYERFTDPSLRDKAIAVYKMCLRAGIKAAAPDMPEYPVSLREIINRPGVIYYIGKLPANNQSSGYAMISVVGSRRCTHYGSTNAYFFSKNLAENGIGIVSGMARGIDSEAHKGALAAGGYTVAVLGGGADVIYPPENSRLYKDICTAGCVISEYPPGTPPYKSNFPARNRIISALSSGTLVIEAAESSGAMITVDRAIEQNKTVYALPGNISSQMSRGCNALIRSGAVCVTSYEDIMLDMGMQQVKCKKSPSCGSAQGLCGAEAACVSAINNGMYGINEIIRYADMSTSDILSALTMLEIKCIVSRASDGTYRLI